MLSVPRRIVPAVLDDAIRGSQDRRSLGTAVINAGMRPVLVGHARDDHTIRLGDLIIACERLSVNYHTCSPAGFCGLFLPCPYNFTNSARKPQISHPDAQNRPRRICTALPVRRE